MDTITNPLLESMSMIAQNAIKDLQYDNTIRCTVVDASRAKEGIYKVSNGTTIFTAYSTENYNKNTEVYVTIPQGDMTNDKVIVGKVVKDKNEPYVYASPFETYIDATGNLIPIAEANEGYGLLTNGKQTTLLVWSKDYTKTPLVGYTRLGLAADFQSWLFEQECVAGNYGLQLVVNYQDKDTSTEELVAINYLDTLDMVGNPYYFDSFFWQEKVFDISTLKKITKISLYFYQKQNFYDINGEKVPSNLVQSDDNFDEFGEELPPNLFTRNFNLSLGYDANEIEGDVVQINTLYNPTYSADKTNEDNKKVLSLLWIRQNERGERYKVVNAAPFTNNDYVTKWYRYNIASESDGYGGICWEPIPKDKDDKIQMELIFNPEITKANEQIKAVTVYGKLDYVLAAGLTQEKFEDDKTGYYVYGEDQYTQCTHNSIYSSDISYYTQIDNRIITESNILTLTNEQEVVSEATINALSALTIICEDDIGNNVWKATHGNYFLYGDNNQLKDPKQKSINRRFKLKFKEEEVTENTFTSIQWSYPTNKNSTMLLVDNLADNAGLTIGYTISNTINNAKLQHNTVTCSVVYKGNTYQASKTLSFGSSSYMGSTGNFDIDFDDGVEVLLIDGKEKTYNFSIHLYDEYGDEQPLYDVDKNKWIYSVNIEWQTGKDRDYLYKSSIKEDGTFTITTVAGKSFSGNQLSYTDGIYILKVDIGGWNNANSKTSYILTKYVPIPLTSEINNIALLGTKEIRYSFDGTPQAFQRTPYTLVTTTERKQLPNAEVIRLDSAVSNITNFEGTMPPTINDGVLIPYPFWENQIESIKSYYAVLSKSDTGVNWIQPIPIYQTPYFSSIVDTWENGIVNLGQEDGTIKAPRFMAGKKNTSNQFSGVVLGDWGDKIGANSEIITKTGLYGFHNGNASFGFNEDGTAFIGKSGAGRILFDGNKSTLESASYKAGYSGIKIDLDDASIDAADFELKAYGFKLDSNGKVEYKDGIPQKDLSKSIIISTRAGFTYDDKGVATGSYTNATPLKIGSNFLVDWTGNMKATNGEFSGTITGSEIALPNASFPNFKVTSEGVVTIKYGSINLGDQGNGTYAFSVNNWGTITAKSGTIGGWTLSGDALTSVNKGIQLNATNNKITIANDGGIELSNDGTIQLGDVGSIELQISGVDNDTPGIGIKSGDNRFVCNGINAGIGAGKDCWVSCQSGGVTIGAKGAEQTIYLNGPMVLSKANYGDKNPNDAGMTGTTGQIYFKIVG